MVSVCRSDCIRRPEKASAGGAWGICMYRPGLLVYFGFVVLLNVLARAVSGAHIPKRSRDCAEMFSLVLVVSLVAASAHGFPAAGNASCKAIPGGSDWPSLETWNQLNQTVGGHLLKPSPPGAVCHAAQATFSAEQCSAVQAKWGSDEFHSDDPVSVEWNNWTNDSCIPDPRLTCNADGYPVYVINATTPQHVKAGIDFGKLFRAVRCRDNCLELSYFSKKVQDPVDCQEQWSRLCRQVDRRKLALHLGSPHERNQVP